jgi:hypothetical protein
MGHSTACVSVLYDKCTVNLTHNSPLSLQITAGDSPCYFVLWFIFLAYTFYILCIPFFKSLSHCPCAAYVLLKKTLRTKRLFFNLVSILLTRLMHKTKEKHIESCCFNNSPLCIWGVNCYSFWQRLIKETIKKNHFIKTPKDCPLLCATLHTKEDRKCLELRSRASVKRS